MSDAAGRTVWTAEYDPFGKATVNQDPDGDGQVVVNNLRFPGQYYDAETGLHYNYHRDYDPATGRYLQPDPIGIQRGRNNLYAYADGNPVSRSDRLGLFSTSDAFWHYFTGSGDVTAYFNEVDIGLQPRDFRGYSSMVASMYKKDGSLAVSLREVRDIGGWAGNQTYSLKGLIQSNVCEWRFKGFIGAFDDPFDFNKMPWGVRAYWKEVVTRAFGYLPAGNSYNIHILGKREVSDGGRWE